LASFGTLKPYEKFAAMIDAHWDGIAAYCEPENKVPLGFVEGLNNKIRVFQRRVGGDNYLGRSATIILAGRVGRERRL
jgi:transposase